MHQQLRLSQNLQQVQKLVMSPRMQQSLKLLALPALELSNLVQQELVENPVLEEGNPVELSPSGLVSSDERVISEEEEVESRGDTRNDAEFDEDWETYFADTSDSGPLPTSTESGQDDLEPVIVQVSTLKEDLLKQLGLSTSDSLMLRIGELIINQLDDTGYLLQPLEQIAESAEVTPEDTEKALRIIQTLDPVGVGARDLCECLLIQYEAREETDPILRSVIEEHIENLEHRRLAKIASALKTTEEKIQEVADTLSNWEPIPARKYMTTENEYLSPDVFVEKVDGEYQIRINDDGTPPLRISRKYRQMLANKEQLTREEYEFLKNKCSSAIWLIRNIEQRRQTLYKVTKKIMEFQVGFLENGISSLRPLRLQDVADAVGVHETTVCRVVNKKYVQTPRGLFELKFFFSTGLNSDTGDDPASKAVMEMIRNLIEQEDTTKPLSDQKISDLLAANGIKIARRTVAKYRENMNILPTNMRKRV